MKRLFNSLLFAIVMFSLLWAGIANADTGAYYDPDRNGEGLFVITDDVDQVAFAFFTHIDLNAANRIEPTPSPAPPVIPHVVPECVITPTIPPGVEIPPTVSPRPPAPPPGEEVDDTLYGGIQAWFTGASTYLDGMAIGDLYYPLPISYPYSFDGELTINHLVGTFLLIKTETGFDLMVDCNGLLPSGLYMCNNTMAFTDLIIRPKPVQ